MKLRNVVSTWFSLVSTETWSSCHILSRFKRSLGPLDLAEWDRLVGVLVGRRIFDGQDLASRRPELLGYFSMGSILSQLPSSQEGTSTTTETLQVGGRLNCQVPLPLSALEMEIESCIWQKSQQTWWGDDIKRQAMPRREVRRREDQDRLQQHQ